jgi:lipoprotein-releasing system ATP-binding protein
LHKSYVDSDGSDLPILKGVDLDVARGEVVAVVGASGAGKSTLLHLLGGLDRPTRGEVYLGLKSFSGLGERELADVRNRGIGFIFQFHHLLREFTARENIMMPVLIGNAEAAAAHRRAKELLRAVGLKDRADHKPAQLSGGERQRVAVARALANDPWVLLADEPSGNLDYRTAADLHELFFHLREKRGVAVVLVTHNRELAGRSDRILELRDGRLNPLAPSVAEHEPVP